MSHLRNRRPERNQSLLDPNEIAAQLATLRPGKQVIYYVGHLAEARGNTDRRYAPEEDLADLRNADEAWRLYCGHRVSLVQRVRPEGGGYDYIAQGRRP